MAAARQYRLFRNPTPTVKRKTREYDRENEACAAIILDEPIRYDGLMLAWAELLTKRLEEKYAVNCH